MSTDPKPKYHVVTIGAATQDVFLISKSFRPWRYQGHYFNLLEYGSKIDVEDVVYDTGGGATNAAVTFARQGLHVSCMAKVGVDAAGREIVHTLNKENVATEHLLKSTQHHTGFSALLKPYNGDRTVLVHRGASFNYSHKDFAVNDLHTTWLYISSLGGNLNVIKSLVNWANRHQVYVAINPGELELRQRTKLARLLRQCQVVIMNVDEACELTGQRSAAAAIRAFHKGKIDTALLTDGPRGSYVLHDGAVFRSGIYKKVRLVDRTGAGDAYGAGFVAAIIRGQTIEQAMSFAAANSTSVISYVGSKTGILRTHDVRQLKVRQVQL